MTDQGKDSTRRPQFVSDEEFAERWEKLFPKSAEAMRKYDEYQAQRECIYVTEAASEAVKAALQSANDGRVVAIDPDGAVLPFNRPGKY